MTFTSTLTAENLFEMVNKEELNDFLEPLKDGEVLVAAIGPVTAKTIKREGYTYYNS